MDDLMARTMVENLSIGIDPLTVRALSPRDCCSNEFVQEALRIVLDNCSLESYGTILERRREEREKEKQERKERRAERYPKRRQGLDEGRGQTAAQYVCPRPEKQIPDSKYPPAHAEQYSGAAEKVGDMVKTAKGLPGRRAFRGCVFITGHAERTAYTQSTALVPNQSWTLCEIAPSYSRGCV